MSARNLNAATHRVWLRSQLISFESLGSWFRSRTQWVSNQRGRRQKAVLVDVICQSACWRWADWEAGRRVGEANGVGCRRMVPRLTMRAVGQESITGQWNWWLVGFDEGCTINLWAIKSLGCRLQASSQGAGPLGGRFGFGSWVWTCGPVTCQLGIKLEARRPEASPLEYCLVVSWHGAGWWIADCMLAWRQAGNQRC